jgi:gamma-glutamylcyclotransferase (GGCT)/AIG2-like uncharacterized protein YtfP
MRYAAYGSNLHPQRLSLRIASARFIATSFVANLSLRFHKHGRDGSAKCNIVPGGDGVHVAIFDISAGDKKTLDAIEGLGIGYSETRLRLPMVGTCVAYVATKTHVDNSLVPYDWYKELVLVGALAHDFPEDYIGRIRTLPTRRDPDPLRSDKSWRIVETIRGKTTEGGQQA